jgi:hypothetical protein
MNSLTHVTLPVAGSPQTRRRSMCIYTASFSYNEIDRLVVVSSTKESREGKLTVHELL